MFEIIILLVAALWLYAFSDDIAYHLAAKKLKRMQRKKLKENLKKGSEEK